MEGPEICIVLMFALPENHVGRMMETCYVMEKGGLKQKQHVERRHHVLIRMWKRILLEFTFDVFLTPSKGGLHDA